MIKLKARQVTDAELLLIHEANQRRCSRFLNTKGKDLEARPAQKVLPGGANERSETAVGYPGYPGGRGGINVKMAVGVGGRVRLVGFILLSVS